MKQMLKNMIAQLSEEDKVVFSQLAEKLNKTDGDISQMSDDELSIISLMESKYSDKLSQISATYADSNPNEQDNLLSTTFASFVRQLLARDLKEQFPHEEDAVKFAFQNKWIPEEIKNKDSASKIFVDYEKDICDANQWREEVVGIESDKSMAVGMTWFMVVYQLHQKLA
ncbi:MAG: hypothetical protein L3J46_06455 [Kangiellaceae bacterium]|nr:hypothetical protein [Kangiellaceae bacterium]